jgi:predicted nucleotidyltransferase
MKIDKDYIIEFLKQRKDFLREKYGVTKISLFGSYARGEENEESDIDFFVEMSPDFFKRCELIEYLEQQFNRKVDVVRKHSNIRKRFLEELEKEAIYV